VDESLRGKPTHVKEEKNQYKTQYFILINIMSLNAINELVVLLFIFPKVAFVVYLSF
jgi:hypothetical protein